MKTTRPASHATPTIPGMDDRYRAELTGYCYRMLGSGFEAEDAVQETLVRGWHTFDGTKGTERAWLYKIATNVCVDMLRSAQRRAVAMDLTPPSSGGDIGEPLPETAWVQPIPDPADTAVDRETIRLAFVAALQHLAPKQRAVLILRDVLCWKADEVAELLDTTTASVNSALQRARATMKAPKPLGPLKESDRDLFARYVSAFERYDVETLVSLLHEDATMTMPPFAYWLRGRETIRAALLMSPNRACENAQVVLTAANGCPAFGQYQDGEPFALVVVEISDGLITGTSTYLGVHLFPLFELPMSLGSSSRSNG
ncbi:sigma-70 family RNA polymerase sigma factor [Lentzea tibetensis]|uniref:Sigma-70 family RNA polymerase sigma factor n=2 Tax=Lentzea tibetensis TaxID=2591470 RepID=A0A563EII6_9PSEU|nr:sigma-70 family RNA polymerase sigma factor [Lentzea tibetensis]